MIDAVFDFAEHDHNNPEGIWCQVDLLAGSLGIVKEPGDSTVDLIKRIRSTIHEDREKEHAETRAKLNAAQVEITCLNSDLDEEKHDHLRELDSALDDIKSLKDEVARIEDTALEDPLIEALQIPKYLLIGGRGRRNASILEWARQLGDSR